MSMLFLALFVAACIPREKVRLKEGNMSVAQTALVNGMAQSTIEVELSASPTRF
jgi:hypothetical protein